jgi:hypothetical protein
MKKVFLLFFVGALYMTFQNLNAQQMRSIQPGQRGYVPPPKAPSEPYVELIDPYKQANIMLPKCVEKFQLDDFEREILKNALIKNFEVRNAILEDKESGKDERKKKVIEADKSFSNDLLLILTPEEVKIFKTMDFRETKEDKKKKKKKKREKRKKG